MNDSPRVGVYICHCGGNISDVVDTKKVAEIISQEDEVVLAKDFIFMCSDAGQKMIVEDVKLNNVTNVIVASCSPRLHQMTFQKLVSEAGINPFTYRHVNIREQVSWVHSHHSDEATEKAIRLIRGAIASAIRQQELEPIEKPMIQVGAVIGGGVSGMTAALEIANKGIPVHLIEQGQLLGGRVLELDKVFPLEEDANSLVHELKKKVESNENIFIHLNTEVVSTTGSVGDFSIHLMPHFNESENLGDQTILNILPSDEVGIDELHVGTVTIATGHDYYVPKDNEFGYNSKWVITLPDLIKYMKGYNSDSLVIHGKRIETVAMIHCVGSRQIEGVHEPREGERLNTSCSRVCCTTTLQQANQLIDRFPYLRIYDFYRDIRTYGLNEKYYKQASQNNVIFIKYPDEEPPSVESEDKKLKIISKDELTYGVELEIDVDLIVLAVGIIPRAKPQIIENLSLPTGADGFLEEAHVKLRPVESATDGVFLAGTAQGPKDIRESVTSAAATAAKANKLLTKEFIELSPFIVSLNENACSGCGECVKECEYNALTLVDKEDGQTQVVITPPLCVGCGACVPVCPEKALTLQGYDLDVLKEEVRAMIKEVQV